MTINRLNIVEIAGIKRFRLEGRIYLVREDFGDMLLVSFEKEYFLFFPKLKLITQCDKHCQNSIFSDGRNLSCLGIRFKEIRKDYSNGSYVISLEGKNIYFHYNENGNKEISLDRVIIPQFG